MGMIRGVRGLRPAALLVVVTGLPAGVGAQVPLPSSIPAHAAREALEWAGLPGQGWLVGGGIGFRNYVARFGVGGADHTTTLRFEPVEAFGAVERPGMFRIGELSAGLRAELHGGRGYAVMRFFLGTRRVASAGALGGGLAVRALWAQPEDVYVVLGAGADLSRMTARGGSVDRRDPWFQTDWQETVLSMPLELGVGLDLWLGRLVFTSRLGPARTWTTWRPDGEEPEARWGWVSGQSIGYSLPF